MADRLRDALAAVTSLVLALAVVGVTGQPAPAAPGALFSVTMVGDDDALIRGDTRLWRTGSGVLDLTWQEDGSVELRVAGGESGEEFDFVFVPPEGEQLAVGSYTGVGAEPWQGEHRAGMSISGENGSCGGGRFRVLDIDPAANRLWLVYETCEVARAELFGEIRINLPPQTPEAVVAPTVVAWPGYYPGQAARPVPVRVVNTGGAPVTIGKVRVTGGAGAFGLKGSDCWTLEPDESCVVYVGFTPGRAGRHQGTLTIPSTGPTWSVPLFGRGIPGNNVWLLRSSEGDPAGKGRDHRVDPVREPLLVAGTSRRIFVHAEKFSAEFTAPDGRTLAESGTFEHGAAEMHVDSVWAYCQEVRGSFTVHDSAFTKSGRLKHLRLTFEQYCEGSDAPLFGSLAWRASRKPVALPPRVHVHVDPADFDVRKGDEVTVSMSMDPGAPTRRVELVATPHEGTPRVLATRVLSAGQTVRVIARPHRTTTFTVRPAGGARVATSFAVVRVPQPR